MFPSSSNAPIAWRAICLTALLAGVAGVLAPSVSATTATGADLADPEDARARARALIAEALEADRKAVAHIEAALAILDASE